MLGIAGGEPVTIKQVEVEIANRAFDLGLVRAAAGAGARPAGGSPWSAPARPGSPPRSSSPGPGTTVTVYERDDAIGGLLRYGIPDFKLEKRAHRPRGWRSCAPRACGS